MSKLPSSVLYNTFLFNVIYIPNKLIYYINILPFLKTIFTNNNINKKIASLLYNGRRVQQICILKPK